MNMLHVGKDKAYDIMKFDENYVDDMWYCFTTHHCIVKYENAYIAYKNDSEDDNDVDEEFNTFDEAINYLK